MCEHCMNRREFGVATTAGLTGSILATSGLAVDNVDIHPWDPDEPQRITGRPLRVQPVLAHAIMSRREKTSWRSWSEIVNEESAAGEMQRISGELKTLSAKAEFPLEILPLAKVVTEFQNVEKAAGGLGNLPPSPFALLSFVALPVIPELRLTDRGMVDVMQFKLI